MAITNPYIPAPADRIFKRTPYLISTGAWMLFWLLFSGLTYGQETAKYTGPYRAGGFAGEARFSYFLKNGDTVLQGPFQLKQSNLESLLADRDTTFSFEGSFRANSPEGAWQFRFGEFETDSLTEVEGYQYKVSVSGTQHEALGLLRSGKPDGLWTHTTNRIVGSKLEETLFRSSIRFENGVPQKNLRIEAGSKALIGRVLRSGAAHDEWTLFSDNDAGPVEKWYFQEGLLLRIETREEDGWKNRTIFDTPLKNRRQIDLDAVFLSFLQWHVEGDAYSDLAGLLYENEQQYQRIQDILSDLGQADFAPGIRVSVAYNPATPEEAVGWQRLYRQAGQLQSTAARILKDPQLQIARRSDAEAQYLYEIARELQSRFVRPLSRLPDSALLPLIDRGNILEKLWPEGVPAAEIRVGSDSLARTYIGLEPHLLQRGTTTLEVLGSVIGYTRRSFDDIIDRLGPRLARQRRAQELLALEEQLVRRLDVLTRRQDSLSENLPDKVAEAIRTIGREGEHMVTTYSNAPDSPDKIAMAEELSECLSILARLSDTVLSLPGREAEIRELYTDQIWNPFTATIMDEAIKRRITGAYRDVLIPYVLDQIINDLRCDTADSWRQLLESAYLRMLELREADTKKLERRLRRVKDPKTVLELFELKPGADGA